MMGLPSRKTSVTTATRLSVILEKSMKALAIGEAIGAVRSRMSMIRTGRVVPYSGAKCEGQSVRKLAGRLNHRPPTVDLRLQQLAKRLGRSLLRRWIGGDIGEAFDQGWIL